MFEIFYVDLTKGGNDKAEVRHSEMIFFLAYDEPTWFVSTYTYLHLLSILDSVGYFFWEQTGSLTSIA